MISENFVFSVSRNWDIVIHYYHETYQKAKLLPQKQTRTFSNI